MAQLTGISLGTYRRLERAELENPSLRHLANCALVLECELEDLIQDEWRGWWPETASRAPTRKEVARLAAAGRKARSRWYVQSGGRPRKR
jgi:transcriptional regulator with XRE-family HTH domain